MTKIPVGGTLARTFGFILAEAPRLLSVTAIPMAIMWLPSFFLRDQMIAISTQVATDDMSGLSEVWPAMLGFYALALLLTAMMVIGIARLALGLDRSWFYLSLGAPVWRLLGSILLLIFVFILGWLAALVVGFVIGFLGTLAGVAALSALLSLLAAAAVFCGYIYCLVRLTFLLLPVIAAEEKSFALVRAWTLSHGNFWRMFAITLIILVPLLVLELVFVFSYLFKGLIIPRAPASPEQMAAFEAAMNTRAAEMMTAFYVNWYITYPLTILVVAIFYGAAIGAQCFAYRNLTEREDAAVNASPP